MLRNGFSVSLRPTVAVLSSCSRGIHTASSARATAFKFTVKHTQLTGGVWRTTFLSSIHSGKGHSVSLPSVFSRGLRTTARTNVAVATGPSQADAWKRFGITAAVVAGAIVATNAVLNRETRDALSPAEKSYLNDSFKYTGGGLALTALVARAMFKNGFVLRVMTANPWVVVGVSLVGSISSMMGVFYTSPENKFAKHAFWLAFNVCQAATLSPFFFLNPAILSRAALYTCGVVGSLSYVGATATNDKFLYMGGPLLAGVTVVALSSLAPLVLPVGMPGLAFAESISLYGGLAVFGGFVLYDTQKILQNARLAEAGRIPRDPVKESVALELDFLNIFIRLVQILSGSQRR